MPNNLTDVIPVVPYQDIQAAYDFATNVPNEPDVMWTSNLVGTSTEMFELGCGRGCKAQRKVARRF